MSVINLMKFNHSAGALIADEEQWYRGIRRLLSFDNLQALLDEEMAEKLGVEVVFGSVGTPSIGFEGGQRIRRRLRELFKAGGGRAAELRTIAGITRIAVGELQTLIRELLNQKLNFCFGFNADDLNRGYFESEAGKVEIKQDSVVKEAQGIATLQNGNPHVAPIIDHVSIIAGYDPTRGFEWNLFEAAEGGVFVGSGSFESIGKGSDVSTLSLIAYANRKQLSERRLGFNHMEAMIELLRSFNEAARFNHEVGGYPHIIIIDGEQKERASRFRELTGDSTKLASETVAAMDFGFIDKELGWRLVEMLLFAGGAADAAEEALFAGAGDPYALEHFLRGYKLDSLPGRSAS
ncbi:hypothetical protein JW905_16015 [bacterium]|nr:hypothetical protein [candidate division CSSED10-310 bacterium]